MEPHEIIIHPLSTEKSIRLLEAENKLVFAVHPKAERKEVKSALEKMFNIKILKVNMLTTASGQKRAYVKLSPEFQAIDIVTDLGLM
ncbi:50S ribosomal protein L23 [Candidatus Woesearchaeota archaeon]|nr:50S ribosomal protein L23 [Candidatus Woesearchaeota archaeon]